MYRCPKCGRELESAEAVQHVCPGAADLAAEAQTTAPGGLPESPAAAVETAHSTPPPMPSSSNRWLVTAGLAASAGAALLTFAMLGGRERAGTCARAGVDAPGAKGRVEARDERATEVELGGRGPLGEQPPPQHRVRGAG